MLRLGVSLPALMQLLGHKEGSSAARVKVSSPVDFAGHYGKPPMTPL